MTYEEIYKLPEMELMENPRFKEWVSSCFICCVSQLVETVLQHEQELFDEIENYYYCPLCEAGSCDGTDCEMEPAEVFEGWIVDSGVYEQLREAGQPVFQYGCNYIWGRCSFG